MPGVPTTPRIWPTSTPAFPQFAFEWHEASQKVYVITIPGRWVDGVFLRDDSVKTAEGVCIAEHCEHHAQFLGFVQTYLRGYRRAMADAEKGVMLCRK